METQTNHKNLAAMTAQLLQNRRRTLKKPFQSFINVPHRMQQVRVKNGVFFINDSKAENVNATYFALQSIKKPVIWIAGGDDSNTNYWELMSLVRQKVSYIIMIGQNNDRLYQLFAPVIDHIYKVKTMREAVQLSYQFAEQGCSVLLSPACKPDYAFVDYRDRGEQFIKAVNKL